MKASKPLKLLSPLLLTEPSVEPANIRLCASSAVKDSRSPHEHAVLAAGGPYVSDTEGESDSDSDSESEIEREGGHHWRCCKERCVCQYSSGIGAEVA